MNEKLKEFAAQAGFNLSWDYHCDENELERFAELVREDERKRLNGVTAHEQMLIDGQQSLIRGKR